MERRICYEVIQRMIDAIPYGADFDLLGALKQNQHDAFYKPPEETIQWDMTSATLQKYIPNPIYDWQFEVLSIFTTKSTDELREIFR